MNNETSVSIRFSNNVTGAKKIEKYAEQLKTINSVLSAIDTGKAKILEESMNKVADDKSKNKVDKLGNALSLAFSSAKLTAFLTTINRVTKKMSEYTKKTATYTENMNLLDVAFNNNTDEAEKFVNTLSEMYGLDESWGYKTVGIFKQLANAMGLADEVGTKMSKTLTQLAIDTSSLYNIEVEDTVSILQSALAGQTKPARRLGADITQSTLQLTLNSAGIDRTIESLSYAEKRLVIVASLLNQTQNSFGDWGRTIDGVAQQMRIFQQQTERLTRAIGSLFLPILKATLPFINAFLMVLTEIINWLAILVGYDPKEFDFFSGTSESVIDLSEGLAGANENAKKLKSGLRGFDKLNNITTPSSGGGASASGGASGIDPNVLGLFNKASDNYMESLSKIENKATRIRDLIMEWLGFTKIINEETGDVSFKFEHLTSGSVLGALGIGGAIYSGIVTISKVLSKFGIISKPLPSLFTLLGKAVQWLWGALSGVVTAIATATGLSVGWVVAIGVAIAGVIALIIIYWDEIKGFFVKMWEGFNEYIINPIVDFISNLATKVYDNVIKPIIDFFKPIFDAVAEIFKLIIDNITEIVVGVGKAVWEIIKKVGEIFLKIVEIFVALAKAFYIYVIEPIFEFIGKIFKWVYDKAIKPIIDLFVNVGTWVYDNIIKPVWDKIVWLKDKAVGIFKEVGKTVVNFISDSIKNVINSVLYGIEWTINKFIKMLNNAIKLINKIPGVEDISYVSELSIPRLKGGMDFVPSDYFPAYLDYGERVLTKEQNADYNRGIINGQNAISGSPVNATFVIKVGDKELAKQVINNIQDMAKNNGKPITIGGF